MPERTDEEIAREVQNGNADSFGLLVDRYEKRLRGYGQKFLKGEDVNDLVQEAFIKAYVNIQSFDPKRRFSPWMYRIAHNEFVNAVRRSWREKIFSFDLDLLLPQPIAPETADSGALSSELRRTMEERLSELPAKYREPLVLYYFEDMDYREISDILRIPVSTVGVRLARGRAILKKRSDPHELRP